MDQVLLLPESVLLELDEPPTAPPWEQLAELMIPKDVVVEAEFEEGDTLALEDRNSFDEEWPGRRVYVFFHGDNTAWLLDEYGPHHRRSELSGWQDGRHRRHGDVLQGGVALGLLPRCSSCSSGHTTGFTNDGG